VFDGGDVSLHLREADAWAYPDADAEAEFNDLAGVFARAILDDEDLLPAVIARANEHIVGDLTLQHHKDAAKESGAKTDSNIAKSLNWYGKASANNMASHLAQERGNAAAASKNNAKANFGMLLGKHYEQQALGHAADRNQAQGVVDQLHGAGQRRLQRRWLDYEY
jgi:hypothetical protein